MSDIYDIMRLSSDLERSLLGPEGKRIIDDIPWLTLPLGYSFKVTFPFFGAAAQFRVCKTDQPERDVSVYLDTKDVLGFVGEPYWEAYPIGDDTGRFLLSETSELIAAIVTQLESEQPTRDRLNRGIHAALEPDVPQLGDASLWLLLAYAERAAGQVFLDRIVWHAQTSPAVPDSAKTELPRANKAVD